MQVKDIILATSMHAIYGSPLSTRVEPLVTRHFPRTAVDLETRQLRMLVAISDEGTVTRAASRLNVSQPALSHALRALERSVGDRRSGRAAESARTTIQIHVTPLRVVSAVARSVSRTKTGYAELNTRPITGRSLT